MKPLNIEMSSVIKKKPLEQSILSSRSQPLTPISTGLLPSGTAMATAQAHTKHATQFSSYRQTGEIEGRSRHRMLSQVQ